MDGAAAASVRSSIAPWLSVRDGAQPVDFYKSAFGATEVYRLEDSEGAVGRRLRGFSGRGGARLATRRVVDPFGLHWEIGHPLV